MTAEQEKDLLAEMSVDRKNAQYYLLNYETEMQDYEKQKERYLESKKEKLKEANTGHGSMPGKPTEIQAIESASYDETHVVYHWLKAVEILVRSQSAAHNLFLRIRKKAAMVNAGAVGRPAWVVYTQMHYMDELSKLYGQDVSSEYISEKTVKKMWQEQISRCVHIFLRLTKK